MRASVCALSSDAFNVMLPGFDAVILHHDGLCRPTGEHLTAVRYPAGFESRGCDSVFEIQFSPVIRRG